jgi:cob(I)alamin adenosyltransferase
MKVYTKTGDQGTTSLIGGTRVLKSSLRIESYGTVDELNSNLGLLRDWINDDVLVDWILEIQDRLFTLGSNLAADPNAPTMKLPEISTEDIDSLERWIDEMDEELEPLRLFVLPGGHPTVSQAHISRCVCRRAERIIVDLSQSEEVNPIIMKYLNRLSDFIFVMSRKLAKDLNAKEKPWYPRV